MNRTRTPTQRLVQQASELSVAAPQVIVHRLAKMVEANPGSSLADRQEFSQMGSEKVQAFNLGLMAMWHECLALQLSMTQSMITATLSPVLATRLSAARQLSDVPQEAAARVMFAGMAPAHAKAVANAKRLRRSAKVGR